MASTTNYGWDTPDNSGLVKNGAQDIRTLGSAIDTSLWNIGFGQAGKNRIINGDFGIWQRGTSFTSQSFGTYYADRFCGGADGGGTRTVSQQTFTPGTAPVAGYESQFFLRIARSVAGSGSSFDVVEQRIEDVRNFAGQTATFSFWAKADAARSVGFQPEQIFGSGGSANVTITGATLNLTTSWVRYTATISVPSVAGKTIGTGSYLNMRFSLPLNTTFTIDIWGVQLEYGSKATPFETASGSIQGELALCQRYLPAVKGLYAPMNGFSTATNNSFIFFNYPVTPRVVPTGITVSSASDFQILNGQGVPGTPVSLTFDSFNTGINGAGITVVSTVGSPTLVSGQGAYARIVSSSGSILFTGCEL